MYISIKNRLILLLVLFTLLPFVLLRIIAYPCIQSDLQEVLIRNLDGISHKQAQLVTNWIHERMENGGISLHIVKGRTESDTFLRGHPILSVIKAVSQSGLPVYLGI